MTVSKSKIIELVNKYSNNKNVQYNIYKIILEKCPQSIKKKDDEIDIEMSKIDDKTAGVIEKYILNIEKSKEYEKQRELELKEYSKEIENTKKDIKVNEIKQENVGDFQIEEKLKNQWKKRWHEDYKGNIDNIYEEHVKKMRLKKYSKKWEQHLKIPRNIKDKMYPLKSTDGNFGEEYDSISYKNKDIDELNEMLDSVDLNENPDDILQMENEDDEDIEDTERMEDITTMEDDEENQLDEETINKLSNKERNKLLFGDSDSDSE